MVGASRFLTGCLPASTRGRWASRVAILRVRLCTPTGADPHGRGRTDTRRVSELGECRICSQRRSLLASAAACPRRATPSLLSTWET